MADYVDLIHLCELIGQNLNNQQIATAAKAVISAAKSCIITNGNYGSAVKNADGLSIWFPALPSLYLNYRAKYMELKCNSTSFDWTDFLDAYHSGSSGDS